MLEKNKTHENVFRKLRNIYSFSINQLGNEIEVNPGTIKNYEAGRAKPTLINLLKFSNYFNISIDYLILHNTTQFIHNIKLFLLAEKIDRLDSNQRYKIEGTSESLIGKDRIKQEIGIKFDTDKVDLTGIVHHNIKVLREGKQLSQIKLAEILGTNQGQIASFEKDLVPSINKIVKLSEIFNISIHAMATGQRLDFSIENKGLKEIICKADQLLSLEDQSFLTHLMTRIIEDS